eukprot:PhF_6_TR44130/c4_g4_i2/m.67422
MLMVKRKMKILGVMVMGKINRVNYLSTKTTTINNKEEETITPPLSLFFLTCILSLRGTQKGVRGSKLPSNRASKRGRKKAVKETKWKRNFTIELQKNSFIF